MRRRIIAPLFVIISLLTGCRNNIELRSDIKKFIASFSVTQARKVYLEAGYTRTDISLEAAGEVKVIESMDFNIKDQNNISFDFKYERFLDDEIQHSTRRYVTLDEGVYTLHKITDGDEITSTISANNIIKNHITNFFYTNEIEEIHSLGMYIGDTLKEILPNIQKYVTVDFDENTLTYNIPWGVKKDADGLDFEEILVVDNLGMTQSMYLHASNGIAEQTSTISVYNII